MKPLKPLLWLALALAAACSPSDPAALIASAKEYLAKRDYNASVIQLKNALQKEPGNAEARYLLGLSSLLNGDVVSAEIELNKASDLGLRSEELQVALARMWLAKGESKKVVDQFGSTQLSAAALHAEMRALVGMALLASNQREQAHKAFEEALARDPANVIARLGAARLLGSQAQLAEALEQAELALSASPSSYEAHLLKAELLEWQGKPEMAESAYRKAIALAGHQIAPRLALVAHFLRQRSLQKAESEVAALEKLAPKDPRTLYTQALLQTEQRKFAAARETILQVLKAAPEHVPSLTLAGLAAFGTGAYPEAEGYLRKAVSRSPDALDARRALAATRLRLGQTDQALKDIQELLARAGKDPAVVALAGEAHLASGDIAGAARYYEAAKALQPANAMLQTRLAQIRFAAGDSERGIKELEAASSTNPDAYQADLALVAAYLRQRQADKALEALKTLEAKQPDNPLTHNLRGVALLLKREPSAARASFERAVQLRPTYMPAVSNLAQLDLRENKAAAARKRFEAVLKKEPANEQALLGLAVLLRVTGASVQEIEKVLKRAVANNPSSARARVSLVNFYLRNRDSKGALAAARDAQAALPNNPAVNEALGVTQLAAGDTVQAIASFMRLAELTPKSPQGQLRLAAAYMAAKQPDEALKSLRAALELQPDLPSAQRDIAAIYVRTGRTDEALRTAREVQSKQPTQPLGYVLEAEVYIAQKDLRNAERTYRAALKKFDLPALVTRTHAVMLAAGKRDEADALAQDWIKRHPKDAMVLAYLGERDLAAKRYASAIEHYRAALERQPDSPPLLNNMAWASHALKRPEALEYAERAHELAPNNAAIMDTLGEILTQRGEPERGLELLGRAAELAPDAHAIRLHFAKALIQAGRKGAARKELELLSKIDSRHPVQKQAAELLAGL